jgi:small conductance mechanosensitive channel
METNTVQSAMNNVQQLFTTTPEWVTTAQEMLTRFGLKIIAAILIFIVGRWVARLIQKVLEKTLVKAKVDSVLIPFTTNLVYTAVLVFVVIAALGQLGVQTTSFITILGAAGLAVGLALQGSLSNFASGVLMIIFRPFKTGDFIEGGGVSGVVKAIHIFTTTLTTPDNKRVIVPNSKMMGDNIINYSAEGTRRIDLTASISYGDSIDTAKAALMDLLTNDPRVLKDPAPFVGVSAMAESSIDFTVRPWVKVADYWAVVFDLNEAIKKRIEAEGLSIPFPQRDVHLYQHNAK